MRRLALKNLEEWFGDKKRKPLIIRGARQVGKSTLVRIFAKQNKLNLIEIDLEKFKRWNSLFEQNNVQKVLAEIQDQFNFQIDTSENTRDLLFFDECQATPFILGLLRYFLEDFPQLPIIAAGSLLEFALEKYSSSLPVGRVNFLYLNPMTFKEFLWAVGEESLANKLNEFNFSNLLTQSLHDRALKLQREFLFVGGMPEAVLEYSESKDSNKVRQIHSNIINVYRDDFNKYARPQIHPRLEFILDYGLMHACEKVKYSEISREYQSKELKNGVKLLCQAKILHKIQLTNSAGIPLSKGVNKNYYKFLFLDVGLMNSGLKFDYNEIMKMTERELLHEGVLAEQFIGQEQLNWGPAYEEESLFYWSREGKSQSAEIDFLAQKGKFIIGIEVKSGVSGKLRSLHQWNYETKYKYKNSLRFDMNLPSRFEVKFDHPEGGKIKYDLISLPLYLASFNPLKLVE